MHQNSAGWGAGQKPHFAKLCNCLNPQVHRRVVHGGAKSHRFATELIEVGIQEFSEPFPAAIPALRSDPPASPSHAASSTFGHRSGRTASERCPMPRVVPSKVVRLIDSIPLTEAIGIMTMNTV